jgi:pyruvate formate lyase activating enzyme
MKTDFDLFKKIESVFQKKITRRDFLKDCLVAGAGVVSSMWAVGMFSKYKAYAAIGEKRGMKEALYYQKMGDEAVKCLLCTNGCVMSSGQRGFCRVREPVDGKLYTLVYELACASHVDPVEKKPLFHFLPGSRSFSIATAGCNSRCKFCQNWTISQSPPEETTNQHLSCANVVKGAMLNRCASIAYTYTEPVIFYEYMLDASKLAKKSGVRNIMVTGGKISPQPLRELCKYIDAAHVDFKGFDDKYLQEVCAQRLEDTLGTLKILKEEGVWIEMVNLVVPTLNDNMDTIKRMCAWVTANLGPDVPLHFSRFWPQYKLRSLYPTPVETLQNARETALSEGIHYVYVGNIPEAAFEDTVCPTCKKVVIRRRGYLVNENNVSSEGKCLFCSGKIAGVWR